MASQKVSDLIKAGVQAYENGETNTLPFGCVLHSDKLKGEKAAV